MSAADTKNHASNRMLSFYIPENTDLLAGIGEVALRHEHLNYVLRMTIKTLANLSINEALDATACAGSSELRSRINKLARQRLGEGEALLKTQALLERCKRATEKRNDLIHSIWVKELDGDASRKASAHTCNSLPSTTELHDLAIKISQLIEELNHVRLDGFLNEALLLKLK